MKCLDQSTLHVPARRSPPGRRSPIDRHHARYPGRIWPASGGDKEARNDSGCEPLFFQRRRCVAEKPPRRRCSAALRNDRDRRPAAARADCRLPSIIFRCRFAAIRSSVAVRYSHRDLSPAHVVLLHLPQGFHPRSLSRRRSLRYVFGRRTDTIGLVRTTRGFRSP